MEQLQRQQEAKLGMNLQEKHLLHAQLLFAQHAAAARASGSRLDPALFGKPDGQTYLAAQQAYNSRIDPDEEDSDEEEQEMVGPEGNDDMEEDDDEEMGDGPHPQAKKPCLQQVPGFPFAPYPTPQASAVKQMSQSPPPAAIKEEQEETELLSPAGQQAFTSPNGFADWGFDESFKQVSYLSFNCMNKGHIVVLRCIVFYIWQ